MTDKQKIAIEFAINTMNTHFDMHSNTTYGNLTTGVTVEYGEAINILLHMIMDNDSKQTNAEIVKVDSLEIIVRMIENKPYYEVKYREVGEKDYSVGYSSYVLNIVLGFIAEYFEIVESDRKDRLEKNENSNS